jgi:hypothetical protein
MRRDTPSVGLSLKMRLVYIGVGLLLVLTWMSRMSRGIWVVMNWRGQATFPHLAILTGVVLIFFGLAPQSWFDKATYIPPSKAKQIESAPFHGKRRKRGQA